MKLPINKLMCFGLVLLLLQVLLADCAGKEEKMVPENGAALAAIYCASCHVLPQPSLLPKATWEQYVLPRMGYMLGCYDQSAVRDSLFEKGMGGELVRQANIFPKRPQISKEQWTSIKRYYLGLAPEALNFDQALPVNTSLPFFELKPAEVRLSPPGTTMVKIRREGGFLTGDANSRAFYQFGQDGQLQDVARVAEGTVQVDEFANDFLLTIMGSFSPTDAPSGMLLALPKDKSKQARVLISQLQRPVHTSVADLDGDQQPDFVIAEFAKWTGKLSWWRLKDGKYMPTVLKKQTGAIRSVITDLDGDGRSDVVALFGQGAEGIWVFYNRGDGNFEEEQLLNFPPTYGSSYFDMTDLDADGDLDIIYTNGDNADYSPVLKPYHGIRFYYNEGNQHFEERFFYSLPGAYKAIPADFDADGDLDIAAISFFPDFQRYPDRGFLFLENKGDYQMEAFTFPESVDGRWLTMDAGDVDQDGDTDLILGSLAFEVIPPTGILDQWVKKGMPFIILKNRLK
ncbi:MAG: FG-GAP-like repeat-containing protein [Saprospiraceae bacterium]|nr:VCBS repeat-containing protein [Lewinella sp.]